MSTDQDHHQPEETLRSRIGNLKALWKEISRPITLPVSIILWLLTFYKYFIGLGNFSYPVLAVGVAAVSVLLLSEGSPRLFAFRIIGFGVDIGFLAVITGAVLLIYRASYGAPNEVILTIVVWTWFFYFVFFDWRLSGTLGKRLFGLQLVSRRKKLTILRTFIRTFLSLIVPLIVATKLGGALVFRGSRSSFVVGFALREALLLVNPISILVFGGHQGISDRLTFTEIVYEKQEKRVERATVSPRSWVLVCLAPLVCGFVLSAIVYMGVGASWVESQERPMPIQIPEKPSGKDMTAFRDWNDPETIAVLWAYVSHDFRNPSDVIQSINIETQSRNPFKGVDTEIFLHPEDIGTVQQMEGIPIVRISVAPWTSPAVYGIIARNLSQYSAQNVAQDERRLTVVQFEQLDDFGVFVFKQAHNTLLDVQHSDQNIAWNLTDLTPRAEAKIGWSLDLGAYAFLGDGASREGLKHYASF